MRSPVLLPFVIPLLSMSAAAHAAEQFAVTIQVGPVSGASTQAPRTITFDEAILRQTRSLDVQDGREHIVRGVSLRELVAHARAPKRTDAVVFVYSDGMQIPVRLGDKNEVDAVFIALEHGDVRERFGTAYPLHQKGELQCPKVVYGRKVTSSYSIWLYPTQLSAIKLVTWKLHEAALAQPTRRLPDRSGWPIYMQHCQPCHGIGGQGATRGADFLSDIETYRRVPPLATTDPSQHPSLHEKVKGFTDGTMPVLNHISNAEISTLWRWLHGIHRSAVK